MIRNDYIEIKNLEVYANHGVLAEEKKLGQKFYIDAKLYVDVLNAAASDDVENSVNYAEVTEVIQKVFKGKSTNLIETAAQSLAGILLARFTKIDRIDMTVKKPSAPVDAHFDYMSVNITRSRHTAYIALGSNIGDREQHLKNALAKIEELGEFVKLEKISSFYNTAPVGYVEQPDFLNAVVKVKTILEPEELLSILQEIENTEGRERKIHWGPRTLDLDILLFDDMVINTDTLVIPHPEMTKRDFVLVPLCEIAPYAIHPLKKEYIKNIREEYEHNSSNGLK